MLGKRLVPGFAGEHTGVQISINSHGMRDREYDARKPPGSLRILALGDSWTFGVGMESEDTWPKRLEALLTSPGRPVAVMNTGVSGYETFHEAFYYRRARSRVRARRHVDRDLPRERRAREGQEIRALSQALQHLAAATRSLQPSEAPLRLAALQQLARGAKASPACEVLCEERRAVRRRRGSQPGALRAGRGRLDPALHRRVLGLEDDAAVVPLDRRDGAERGSARSGDSVPGSPRSQALPRLQPPARRAVDPQRSRVGRPRADRPRSRFRALRRTRAGLFGLRRRNPSEREGLRHDRARGRARATGRNLLSHQG